MSKKVKLPMLRDFTISHLRLRKVPLRTLTTNGTRHACENTTSGCLTIKLIKYLYLREFRRVALNRAAKIAAGSGSLTSQACRDPEQIVLRMTTGRR